MGYMLMGRKDHIGSHFRTSISASLTSFPGQAQQLFDAYNIHEDTPDDQAIRSCLGFCTDIAFYASAATITKAWPSQAYLYHFNVPNPWDGPNKGEVSHILDVAFLFQNFNQYLTKDLSAVARKFALHFISFVNGREPYPPQLHDRPGVQVYGSSTDACAYFNAPTYDEIQRGLIVWQVGAKTGLDTLREPGIRSWPVDS